MANERATDREVPGKYGFGECGLCGESDVPLEGEAFEGVWVCASCLREWDYWVDHAHELIKGEKV